MRGGAERVRLTPTLTSERWRRPSSGASRHPRVEPGDRLFSPLCGARDAAASVPRVIAKPGRQRTTPRVKLGAGPAISNSVSSVFKEMRRHFQFSLRVRPARPRAEASRRASRRVPASGPRRCPRLKPAGTAFGEGRRDRRLPAPESRLFRSLRRVSVPCAPPPKPLIVVKLAHDPDHPVDRRQVRPRHRAEADEQRLVEAAHLHRNELARRLGRAPRGGCADYCVIPAADPLESARSPPSPSRRSVPARPAVRARPSPSAARCGCAVADGVRGRAIGFGQGWPRFRCYRMTIKHASHVVKKMSRAYRVAWRFTERAPQSQEAVMAAPGITVQG